MYRLIDIAGRTGHGPVRSLLSQTVGSEDVTVLLNHEIRYRNDQHRVIYGLYRGTEILGLIGLARNPAEGNAEILHFAHVDGSHGAERILLEMVLARVPRTTVVWCTPESYQSIASHLGFRPDHSTSDGQPWQRPSS